MQRRLERNRIIYTWKILENLAPNCGITEIGGSDESRLGRRLKIPSLKGNPRTNKLKEQAFQINGPKLFNCLPQKVRNQTGQTRKQDLYSPGAEDFKYKLDMHLETVPDQPRIDGMSPGVETNSILHQSKRGPGGGLLSTPGA